MGVLECDRKGCEQIMCSRIILHGTSYICDDCWRELLSVKQTWPERMTETDATRRIKAFMETEPGNFSDTIDRDEAFSRALGNEPVTEDER